MVDMRELPLAAAPVTGLTERDKAVLRYVAKGLSPREIAERVEISEEELYRFVAWILDEVAPAPDGDTMSDVHARHGSRPGGPGDVQEFERRYGASLPPDDEG